MIVWPSDPFSDLMTAEEVCTLVDQIVDQDGDVSYPLGIEKHKLVLESLHDTPSKFIKSCPGVRSNTVRVTQYIGARDQRWLVALPIGRNLPKNTKSKAEHCQYIGAGVRFYLVNRKSRSFVNLGPVSGCIIDQSAAIQTMSYVFPKLTQYRNIRVQSGGVLELTKNDLHISSWNLSRYGFRLVIGVRPETLDRPVGHNITISLEPVDLDVGVRPRPISLDKLMIQNPDLRIDLTQPDLGITEMDLMFLMYARVS